MRWNDSATVSYRFDGSAVAAVAACGAAVAAPGNAAGAAEAPCLAQAVSISARARDSLVVPSGLSSSCCWRRLPFCSNVRSGGSCRSWLAVAAVAVGRAAVAAGDKAAVAAAADPSSAVCARHVLCGCGVRVRSNS